MKKPFNLFSLTFTIVSIMVCIIFAFNCGGDDKPVDEPMKPGPKPTEPTACENPELTFPDCLPPLPVCDDPATTDAALTGGGYARRPLCIMPARSSAANRRYGN